MKSGQFNNLFLNDLKFDRIRNIFFCIEITVFLMLTFHKWFVKIIGNDSPLSYIKPPNIIWSKCTFDLFESCSYLHHVLCISLYENIKGFFYKEIYSSLFPFMAAYPIRPSSYLRNKIFWRLYLTSPLKDNIEKIENRW